MTGLFLVCAVALACLGAWQRDKADWAANHTVWILLASAAVSCAVILARVPFDMALWVMFDVAVIAAIELGTVGHRERAIIGTFPFAWALYHMQPEGWAQMVNVIVAGQLLLTVPWDRLARRRWTEKAV